MTDITTESIRAKLEARLSALTDIANERDTDMQQLKLAQDITHAQIDELTNALEFFKLTETVAAPATPKPERKKRRSKAQIANDNRTALGAMVTLSTGNINPAGASIGSNELVVVPAADPLNIPSFLQRDKEPTKHGDEA